MIHNHEIILCFGIFFQLRLAKGCFSLGKTLLLKVQCNSRIFQPLSVRIILPMKTELYLLENLGLMLYLELFSSTHSVPPEASLECMGGDWALLLCLSHSGADQRVLGQGGGRDEVRGGAESRKRKGKKEREKEKFTDVTDPARLSALFVGGHNLDDLLSLMPTHWAFTVGHHN